MVHKTKIDFRVVINIKVNIMLININIMSFYEEKIEYSSNFINFAFFSFF